MKKVNFSKGTVGRLSGAAVGGAVSAVWDSYLTPMLPTSVSAYPDYVKIVAGAVLPMFVKGNQLINTACDGLMTCGIQNVVADLLTGTGSGKTTDDGDKIAGAPLYINGGNGRKFPSYERAIRVEGTPKTVAKIKKQAVYQG